ncbi:putative SUMF1/EgtB/PvdO family nonheme iron enzyme [Gammaproteobacteria bacterium]
MSPRINRFQLVLACLMAMKLAWAGGATEAAELITSVNLREKFHVLLIGVYDYKNYFPLEGPKNDIAAINTLFKDLGVENLDKPIENPETKEDLIKALEEFVEKYGQNQDNRLVIYFSGHGEIWPKQPEEKRIGYVLPTKTPHPDLNPQGFENTALRMDFFKELANRIQSRHVLFIFDNCFSGSVFKTHYDRTHTPKTLSLVGNSVRFLITAGSGTQAVPDQSIFRRHLINGLMGEADYDRDGYITGSELGQYLRSKVGAESRGKQKPVFGWLDDPNFGEEDFIFYNPVGGGFPVKEQLAKEPVLSRGPGKNLLLRDNCPVCPQMVVLPSGDFWMGSPETEEGRQPDEPVRSKATIERPFAIGQTEVTFGQWDACFQEGGSDQWPEDYGWGRGMEQPVVNVNFQDALQFARWLSKKTGATYRLLTEKEWEYAARGGKLGSRYWEENLDGNHANCRGCGSKWDSQRPAPVRQFQSNSFNLYDMLGNVWEWVCVGDSIAKCRDGENGILRGGSFATTSKGVRAAARGIYPLGLHNRTIGFRVARDLSESELSEWQRQVQ